MQGIELIFSVAILIISVVAHEFAHGYAAYRLGDPTAKYSGRLTLNPLKHIDMVGSIIVPLIAVFGGGVLFGWAKPVPYNPYNLKNQRWGPLGVAIAGPITNFAIAIFFGTLFRYGQGIAFIPHSFWSIVLNIILVNIVLATFNLIPFPPLDGSKILYVLLPSRWYHIADFLEQYGIWLLIFLIFFFSSALSPVIFAIFQLFTGMPIL